MSGKIIGLGSYLPERILTNADLEKFLDTSDDWITSRTGIKQRHIAAEGEFTSNLAHKACLSALSDGNVNIDEIDLIIVCTTTPDLSFPSVATKVQGLLAPTRPIPAFDLQAVCGGFIYGLHLVNSLISSGAHKTIMLVGAEKMSSLLNWEDRGTCILFGDGAGALILQRSTVSSGIIDTQIFSDGSFYDILKTDGGVGLNCAAGTITMNGKETFKQAVERMSESMVSILRKNNLSIDMVDHIIPHQANARIINSIAQRLEIDPDKAVVTIDKHANCSAASIPLALADAKGKGRFKKDDLLLFTALGGGLTWGSALLRW